MRLNISGLTDELPTAFTIFMNKKNFILIAIVLALAGAYAVFFTGLFRHKTIQIIKMIRPVRVARTGVMADQVVFSLDNYYSLTEVTVVPLAAMQPGKLAQPVWHLVSEEGSDDVKGFYYSEDIDGMDPAVQGSRPEPLQPGVMYRLTIAAGRATGQIDFQLGVTPVSAPETPPKPTNPDD
jgi:hypothetical protein